MRPAEIEACARAGYGPAMPREVVETSVAQGRQLTEAYCRMHPEECGGYRTAVTYPTATKIFGTQIVGAVTGADEVEGKPPADWPVYLALAGAGVGLLMLAR